MDEIAEVVGALKVKKLNISRFYEFAADRALRHYKQYERDFEREVFAYLEKKSREAENKS